MVQAILGISIPKDKDLQNCNWEARPLSERQMKYAAADSLYSLKIYRKIVEVIKISAICEGQDFCVESSIIPPKFVYPRCAVLERAKCSYKVSADDDWHYSEDTIVQPVYAGAFLAPTSREELMRAFKPKHQNVTADHVTFSANITSKDKLQQFLSLMGKTCVIGIDKRTAYAASEKSEQVVDCVIVESFILDETKQSIMALVASGYPHITLSTGPNTQNKASIDVISSVVDGKKPSRWHGRDKDTNNIMYLRAVVGLVVIERGDLLAGLTPKSKKKIEDFVSTKWIMGEQLRFTQGELSSAERRIIHIFCESNNLESRSDGPSNKRQLTLVKKRNVKLSMEEKCDASRHCIKNCDDVDKDHIERNGRVFKCGNEAIDEKAEEKQLIRNGRKRITDKSRSVKLWYDLGDGTVVSGSSLGDIPPPENIQNLGGRHGKIVIDNNGDTSLEWKNEEYSTHHLQKYVMESNIIILRGLPGSGKSSLANTLRMKPNSEDDDTVICSADSFFTNGAGLLNNRDKKRLIAEGVDIYSHVFSTTKLQDSHQYCWESFKHATDNLINRGTIRQVIVDNTNSRQSEYAKYVNYAIDKGLTFLILEITCPGPSQVSTFCQRSKHNVPQRACQLMFNRWDSDERAINLEPFTGKKHL